MLKNKNKSKSLVILLCIMIIVSITGTSIAADYSCKVELIGNKTELKQGDSVTILVKATNIQAGEGIASFSTMLDYDANIFECTVSGDDEGNWQKQGFIENSLTMTRSDLLANSSDQTIAKIVLTAKSDAPSGKQTFKLTEMEFSTGEETFSVADVSNDITITDGNGSENGSGNGSENGSENVDKNTNTESNNINTSNNVGGNSTGGASNKLPSGSGTSTNGKTEYTTANSIIPKTGVTNLFVIGAVIGTIVAIMSYIRYKKTY